MQNITCDLTSFSLVVSRTLEITVKYLELTGFCIGSCALIMQCGLYLSNKFSVLDSDGGSVSLESP